MIELQLLNLPESLEFGVQHFSPNLFVASLIERCELPTTQALMAGAYAAYHIHAVLEKRKFDFMDDVSLFNAP